MYGGASVSRQRRTRSGSFSVGVTARAEVQPAIRDPWGSNPPPALLLALSQVIRERLPAAVATDLRAEAVRIFQNSCRAMDEGVWAPSVAVDEARARTATERRVRSQFAYELREKIRKRYHDPKVRWVDSRFLERILRELQT